MKANLRARNEHEGNDEGVSPVIAVILMVAITVVLAATVYVWVSGFSSDEQGTENAQVRATGFDASRNGATDYIKLSLVRGENAPYGTAAIDFNATDQDNNVWANGWGSQPLLCTDISASPTAATASTPTECTDSAAALDGTETWSVGQSLYVPCQGDGAHHLELTLRNSVVLDEQVRCDEVPT